MAFTPKSSCSPLQIVSESVLKTVLEVCDVCV